MDWITPSCRSMPKRSRSSRMARRRDFSPSRADSIAVPSQLLMLARNCISSSSSGSGLQDATASTPHTPWNPTSGKHASWQMPLSSTAGCISGTGVAASSTMRGCISWATPPTSPSPMMNCDLRNNEGTNPPRCSERLIRRLSSCRRKISPASICRYSITCSMAFARASSISTVTVRVDASSFSSARFSLRRVRMRSRSTSSL